MWSDSCETGVNSHITKEYTAWYAYQQLSAILGKSNVGFDNASKFFKKRADEELEHAQQFIEYQMMRGGHCVLGEVKASQASAEFAEQWKNGVAACGVGMILHSLRIALDMETQLYHDLRSLYEVASAADDQQFMDLIESTYLKDQLDDIHYLNKEIAKLSKMDTAHAEWDYDQHLE